MSRKVFDYIKGEKNPKKDMAKALAHEKWAQAYLEERGFGEVTRLDGDKHKDLLVKEAGKKRKKRVQVKREAKSFLTGNLYFEVSSRNKISGMIAAKGKVDWWFESFLCKDGMMRFGVAKLSDAYKLVFESNYEMNNGGGDRFMGGYAATGMLVPWEDFLNVCFWKDEMKAEDYVKELKLYE